MNTARAGGLLAGALAVLAASAPAQERAPDAGHTPAIALQPLAQQVRAIVSTLAYLGQPLPADDVRLIDEAIAAGGRGHGRRAGSKHVLDPHVLVIVEINPESRVKVEPGPGPAPSWSRAARACSWSRCVNQAGVTAPLDRDQPEQRAPCPSPAGDRQPGAAR